MQQVLMQAGAYAQACFYAQQTGEKAIKALVARHTRALPPFIHDLVRLADQAAIPLDDEQRAFLAACNRFAVHGRYEMPQAPIVASHEVAATWDRVQEMVQWLLTL